MKRFILAVALLATLGFSATAARADHRSPGHGGCRPSYGSFHGGHGHVQSSYRVYYHAPHYYSRPTYYGGSYGGGYGGYGGGHGHGHAGRSFGFYFGF